MNMLIGWLMIGLAIILFVTGLLAALIRQTDASPRSATCIMLVLLRLAIGWHFFIEGVEKLQSPTWSSAGYLREATGPLGPRFRAMAGDPVVDMMTGGDKDSLPEALEQNWQNYLDAVIKFYRLNEAQADKLRDALTSLKKQTAMQLVDSDRKKEVERIAPYPPPLKQSLTLAQRIEILGDLQDEVAELEAGRLPQYAKDVHEAWKTAKANVNRWRGDLQKDLDLLNRQMKRTIRQTLLELTAAQLPEEKRAKLEAAIKKQRNQADSQINGGYAKTFDKLALEKGTTYAIDMSSPDFDCYLRLEDGSGIVLAENWGSGKAAHLSYHVPDNKAPLEKQPDSKVSIPDTYRIIAGAYGKSVGRFTLDCHNVAAGPASHTAPPKEPAKAFVIGTPFTTKLDSSDKDPVRKPSNPEDWDSIDKIGDKLDDKIADECRKSLDPNSGDELTKRVFDNILTRKKKDQPALDPLPFPVNRPLQQWSQLDWSDRIVKYGIAAVGLLLLLGLFTRSACVAGAGFLLMFYLAMPPLPGYPDGPRTEGHYLFINKNIIEMLALLVLATTYSGRWLGLDGMVQFLNPWRWRTPPTPVKMRV